MTALIQARSTSTRFPNKVMADLGGQPMINHIWNRVKEAIPKTAFVIPHDDQVKKYLYGKGYLFLEGPLDNVLQRYYWAAMTLDARWVARVTADCPLIDTPTLLYMANFVMKNNVDFITNTPCVDGFDVEIMSMRALEWAFKHAITDYDKEHVTTFIKSNRKEFEKSFSYAQYKAPYLPEMIGKISVDTEEDLNRVREVYEKIYG